MTLYFEFFFIFGQTFRTHSVEMALHLCLKLFEFWAAASAWGLDSLLHCSPSIGFVWTRVGFDCGPCWNSSRKVETPSCLWVG